MKLKTLFLATAISLATANVNAQQADTTFKANPNLTKALSYVDTDGEALSISNDKEFLEDMATYYDAMLSPFLQMSEQTHRFNFNKMLKVFGMNGITSTATSCKKYDGHYINKFFIQTSSQHNGFWSLWGKANQATVAQTIAPAGSNLVLETQLNSQQLYDMLMETLKMVNPDVAEVSVRNFGTEIPELGMTAKELLSKIDSRISIVSTIDLTDSIKDMAKPPKYQATARIDNVANLLWAAIQPELSKLGKINTEGNQHSIDLPDLETEIGPLVFTLHFDLDKNFIWFTTDKAHLKQCRDSSAPKLATDKQYLASMEKLPQTGCAQFYISKDLIADVMIASEKSLDFAGENEPIPTIQKLIVKLQPMMKNSQGISWIAQKNKDGILFASNTPFRIRGGMVQYTMLTATLSSIATPLVLSKRKEANRTINIAHLKQFMLAFLEYENDNGQLPENLEVLLKAHPEFKQFAIMKTDQGDRKAVYIFRKNPKADDIIMHTPVPIDGKHVILKYDGSVTSIPAGQLAQLLR